MVVTKNLRRRLGNSPLHLCPPRICCHYIMHPEECASSVHEDKMGSDEQLRKGSHKNFHDDICHLPSTRFSSSKTSFSLPVD